MKIYIERAAKEQNSELEWRKNDEGDGGNKTEYEVNYRGRWRRVYYRPNGAEYINVMGSHWNVTRKVSD